MARSQAQKKEPQEAPITSCDTYAADEADPHRVTGGLAFDKVDPTAAIPACRSALQQYPKSSRLTYQLGRAFLKRGDFDSAVVQFRAAAYQGYASAQHSLGQALERGQGVAHNDSEAAAWYRKAADQSYAFSEESLGNMYFEGRGVSQDYNEAIKLLRKAADQGVVRATVFVGLLYITGQGVSVYYTAAAKWIHEAVERGDSEGELIFGEMYEEGIGVPKDRTEAARLYRKAAEQGQAEAKAKLAAYDSNEKAGQAAAEAGDAALRRALAGPPSRIDPTSPARGSGGKHVSCAAGLHR